MLKHIEDRAREVLARRPEGTAAISCLLGDDALCVLMMRHRQAEGMALPDQSPDIPRSARLAYLQALAADDDVAAAREACDGRQELLKRMEAAREIENTEMRDLMVRSVEALMHDHASNSHWAGQYLLYGQDRIAVTAIPLHARDADHKAALTAFMSQIQRPMDPEITISDRNPDTEALGFIRVGRDPAHFSFPETAGPRAGTNAALLHYEIDHPGGAFTFFTAPGPKSGVLAERFRTVAERDPLYPNDPAQLMARNSYMLQSLGAFHVRADDSEVTMLLRGGVLTASDRPDLSGERETILAELERRGVGEEDRAVLSDFLAGGEVDDDDWVVMEELRPIHPDLLGHTEMGMDRSHIFGMPRQVLLEQADALLAGDRAAAEAEVVAFLERAELVELPAGRLHLYVPNLASTTRFGQGLEALDAATGRAHRDMWFVLADRELDLGEDPHVVTSMRLLGRQAPTQDPFVCDMEP